jgi:hypothetical protein
VTKDARSVSRAVSAVPDLKPGFAACLVSHRWGGQIGLIVRVCIVSIVTGRDSSPPRRHRPEHRGTAVALRETGAVYRCKEREQRVGVGRDWPHVLQTSSVVGAPPQ